MNSLAAGMNDECLVNESLYKINITLLCFKVIHVHVYSVRHPVIIFIV